MLPGKFTSVLTQEFVVPTHEENIKLFLCLRQAAGPRNRFVQDSDLFNIIRKLCKSYWHMAGSPILTDKSIKEKLKKLLSGYREHKKNESKSGVPETRRREFQEEAKKLFNITGQDIEKRLGTDRIRKNLDVVEEDLVL